MLIATNITAGYTRDPVLLDVSLEIEHGGLVALCGANGSGKSTLLRVLARLLRPRAGSVTLGGRAIGKFARSELARTLAFMPQNPEPPLGVSVRELVGYGRSPHVGLGRRFATRDRDVIEHALELCDLRGLAEREVTSLSGGERQRSWLAMTVAQEADVLLLDEPVSALDVGHQLQVLELLQRLNREKQTTIVTVLHDINVASRYFDTLVGMRDGRIVADGPMEQLLTPTTLGDIFDVTAQVHTLPDAGYPVCTFERA